MRDPREGVSPSGAIVTGARRVRVPSQFEPVLAAASDLLAAGDKRAAVYLYGSVATGQARVPTSDVDLSPSTSTAASSGQRPGNQQ